MIKVITTNKSKLLFHERCDQMVWFQRRGTMPRMYCQCIKNNTYQTLSSEDVDLRFVSPNRNRKKKELILFRKQLNRQKPVFINPNVFDGKYVIGLKVLAVLEPFGGGTIIKSRIVKVRVPSGDSFSTSSTVPPLTSSTDTPTQSVSSISHNSINPSEKPCTLITTTTTADTTNEATGENTNETAVKEEEEKQNECEASTTAAASVMKTQSDEASSHSKYKQQLQYHNHNYRHKNYRSPNHCNIIKSSSNSNYLEQWIQRSNHCDSTHTGRHTLRSNICRIKSVITCTKLRRW
eukprot:1059892_1